MSEKYSLFRKVSDQNLLINIKGFLTRNEVDFITDQEDSHQLIMVSKHQLQRLENLMLQNNDIFLDSEPDDFYLQGFSEKELLEIVLNPTYWSAIDYHLSVNILGKRGLHIDNETLTSLRSVTLTQGKSVYA